MKCEALANISRVMTNERSFSVVNASAPVGTTDKLSDFYLTCLVFHQFPAAHLKVLVITSQSVSLTLHSLLVRIRITFNILSSLQEQHLISYITDNNIDFLLCTPSPNRYIY